MITPDIMDLLYITYINNSLHLLNELTLYKEDIKQDYKRFLKLISKNTYHFI